MNDASITITLMKPAPIAYSTRSVVARFFHLLLLFCGFAAWHSAVAAQGDDAIFVRQSVQAKMDPGQPHVVSVTMRNSGITTWSAGDKYRLGSWNPENNSTWGPGRVELPRTVGPGEEVTFTFSVTAPAPSTTPYNFQWKMLQEGVAWFGLPSENVSVQVNDHATFVRQSVAEKMDTGQPYAVSVTMRNSGTTTWSTVGEYRLGAWNPQDNSTWGRGRVELPKTVGPGEEVTFTFSVIAPAPSANPYKFQWRMLQEGVAWFGLPSNNVSVAVVPQINVSPSPLSLVAGEWKTVTWSSTGATKVTRNCTASGTGFSTIESLPPSGQLRIQARSDWVGYDSTCNWTAEGNGASNTFTQTMTTASQPPPTPTASLTAPASGTSFVAAGATASVSIEGSATADGGSAITKLELIDRVIGGSTTVLDTKLSTERYSGVLSFAPGTYSLSLRATNAAGVQAESSTVGFSVKAGNYARGVGQTIPTTEMRAGEPYKVTVLMRNDGGHTWTHGAGYRLGARNPTDNRYFGGRAYLTRDVAPGETAEFTFEITAPPARTEPYNFQWQMVQEYVDWFGEPTQNIQIKVVDRPGPVVAMSASHANSRVSGTQTQTVTFTGKGSRSGGTVTKLELFQDSGKGYGSPIHTLTGSAAELSYSHTLNLPAGVYTFKLRATDSNNVRTDSAPVYVNITNSALLGTVSGVRTNSAGSPELYGWVCQPGSPAGLPYYLLLDAPSFEAGGVPLTEGVANVNTEVDSAAVRTQCNTPGAGHHFVVDLTPYLANYAGRSVYVLARSADGATKTTLPCADNNCTIPGTLRVGLTDPTNGAKYPQQNSVFLRMQLTNQSGSFDEIGFVVDDQWVPAAPDGAVGAYSVKLTGLATRTAPYTVYAKVRQGNMTLQSAAHQFNVVEGTGTPGTGGTGGVDSQTMAAVLAAVNMLLDDDDTSGTETPPPGGTTPPTAGGGLSSILVPHMDNRNAGTLPGELSVTPSGTASYTIPLAVPPGTAGMQPQLALSYDSSGPNGLLGLGWKLDGLSTIHRCAKTIAQDGMAGRIAFDRGDRLCLDGVRLFRFDADPLNADEAYWAFQTGVEAEYRTEIEGFARITREPNGGFKVAFKDGRIHFYGIDSNSAIAAQGRSDGQPLLWALARTEDRSGNYMTFKYATDGATGEYLPMEIRYGGNTLKPQAGDLAVRFKYLARTDAQIQYLGGARNDLRSVLTNVQTLINTATDGTGGTLVRNYIIRYEASAGSGRSLIKSVQLCSTLETNCLPATTIGWGSNPLQIVQKKGPFRISGPASSEPGAGTMPFKQVSGDFNNSGLTTLLHPSLQSENGNTNAQYWYITDSLYGRNAVFDNIQVKLTLPQTSNKFTEILSGDMNGDGRDDVVLIDTRTRAWAYCLAGQSPTWGQPTLDACQIGGTLPPKIPTHENLEGLPQLVSLRNDGKADLIVPESSTLMRVCRYNAGAISCTAHVMENPEGNPVLDYVPLSLSSQGMTDFYSAWQTVQYDNGKSGVTVCNFYNEQFKCKNLATGAGQLNYFSGGDPADVNGDGLTDAFYYEWSGVLGDPAVPHLCLSMETNVACKPFSWHGLYSAPSAIRVGFTDVIGDGLNRYLAAKPRSAQHTSFEEAVCRIVDGRGECSPIDVSTISTQVLNDYSKVQMYTIDNSGLPALLKCSHADAQSNAVFVQDCVILSTVAPANQDKVVSVVNGVGQREEIDYARGDDTAVYSRFLTLNGAEQLPTYPKMATSPDTMVKQMRKGNGKGGWLTYSYRYAGAMRDAYGRGSLGFSMMSSTDPNGVTTTTYFDQNFPHVGFPLSETKVVAGCTIAKTVSVPYKEEYSLWKSPRTAGASSFFVATAKTTLTRRNVDWSKVVGNGPACTDLGEVITINGFTDTWGNLNNQTIEATGGARTFITETTSVYNVQGDATQNFLAGLPLLVTTTRKDPETGSLTRTIAYGYDSVTGLLSSQTIEPNAPALKVVTSYGRSPTFGLVNTETQEWKNPACADPGWTSLEPVCPNEVKTVLSDTTYDVKGRFAEWVKNALHTPKDPFSEKYTYDARSGHRTSRTDANGLTTIWTLDDFGRVIAERSPDGSEKRTYLKDCAGACPNGATVALVTEHLKGSSRISAPTVQYIDSAGHVVRNLTWGFDGRVIVSDKIYDDLGRESDTYWPRYETDPLYLSTRVRYDGLSRVIEVISVDEDGLFLSNKTDYHGFDTDFTNAASQVRTEIRDVIGQLREVLDSNVPTRGRTKFDYDPFGNLSKTVDPNGNVISVGYDRLGRKTSLNDPDLGVIRYNVDPIGRTWSRSNLQGGMVAQTVYMKYDALGRMIARYEPDLTSTWTFDTPTRGMLVETCVNKCTVNDYRRTHTYDEYGRPSVTTQRLADATYTSRLEYDDLGRVATHAYGRVVDPTKSDVREKTFGIRYNNYGYLDRVERGTDVLWRVTAMDAFARPIDIALGNGLRQTKIFNVHTARLKSATTIEAATKLLRVSEANGYDKLGNVKLRSHYWNVGGFEEKFDYDELNRLESSQVDSNPSQTYSYDLAGNLLSKTGVGTYTYPAQGQGAVRPHAVQTISSAPGTIFTYDNRGNLKSGGGHTVDWMSFDMPKRINKGAVTVDFLYGSEHQRIHQTRVEPHATTTNVVYAGAQEVEKKQAGPADPVITVKTYWPFGIGLEIDSGTTSSEQSSEIYWTHTDRLGNVIAVSNADGELKERLAYDAWGKRRSTEKPYVSTPDGLDGGVDNRGFTGHEMLDQLDLVHMNGRVYNPWLGKFLSADPLISDPTNGQRYNRYSYVLNNPTNLTDPTGFKEENPIPSVPVRGTIDPEAPCKGEGCRPVIELVEEVQRFAKRHIREACSGSIDFMCNSSARAAFSAAFRKKLAANSANKEKGLVQRAGDAISGEIRQQKNYLKYNLDNPLHTIENATAPLGAGGVIAGVAANGGKLVTFLGKLFGTGAESAADAVTLSKSLASQAQMGEEGIKMAGVGARVRFRDAERVAREHGGNAADWVKMSSSSHSARDGTIFETHWVENIKTGQRVEFKTKFPGRD